MKLLRILGIFAILLVPVNANAHAGVVSTSPERAQELTIMPAEISVTFSEDLLLIDGQDVNTITFTHFAGEPVEITNIKVEGATISATIPEGEYQSGIYEVSYKVVSADGHKVSDSYSFSLNTPTLYAVEGAVEENESGVIPLPILGAIVIVVLLGGFFALRARNRKR